ncbi:phage tail tape measure protein [Brenneria populi]|uniref:Phage tail tape measure protein n=1 Tax=Brenneria populi TaxID=1505588 RepID=A0ABU6JX37_9GAMM|nr:phage tail tape measure protein [Brenneria populi Li et al. 2015]
MSNSLKLQVFLKAVDQATRPFKAVQTASKTLSGEIKNSQQQLKNLNAQAGKIDGFRKASAQLAVTGQSLEKAKAEAAALAVQFKNTEHPTRAQAQAMESAKRAAAELQTKHNSLRLSVQRQRTELQAAGVNTRELSSAERQLRGDISQTTATLNRQREALLRVSKQQEKLNAVSQRYEKGKALAGNVRNTSAAALGVATAGAMAGVGLLKPGYEFSLKNSSLQATLGLEKESADMKELKEQARRIGDNTAASADDAAAAQNIIAKAGGDKAAIMAATPVTLNMSLANSRTMEENASLLMSAKSSYGLENKDIAHIGDVISATLNKTAANFDGLSDALTYMGSVAKNAGVSIEQTNAMIGALAQDGITGSMAGTAGRAVLMRLQAPTGQAYSAIKELGVKTADNKGNMRPLFTILKEMQNSFDKHKLGSAQRAEYMKVIFGEEAAAGAASLLKSAANGYLDSLTKTFQKSDGSTEALVKIQQDNLGGDFKEFQSAYEAVGNDLFDQQESSLRKLTQTATKYVLKLDEWIQKNPQLAKTLTAIAIGGTAIIGVLGAIGLVVWPVMTGINALIAGAGLLSTGFSIAGGVMATAIGAISWPVVGVVAAIVAGALLIRKYWEPISAFFGGVVEGLKVAFAPIAELFAPLQPVFDWLGEKLKAAWEWFKQLVEPVKTTQDSLNSCRDAGVAFGQMLANALTLPVQALNQLRGGIDWVLEKLGVIDSKSSDLNDKVPRTPFDYTASEALGYSPSGGLLNAKYAPVTASGNAGMTDNSRTENNYQITIPPGMSKDEVLSLLAQHSEQQEREKRARQRSQMDSD